MVATDVSSDFFLPRSLSIVQDMNGGYFARFFLLRGIPRILQSRKSGLKSSFGVFGLKHESAIVYPLSLKYFAAFSLKPMYMYLPL